MEGSENCTQAASRWTVILIAQLVSCKTWQPGYRLQQTRWTTTACCALSPTDDRFRLQHTWLALGAMRMANSLTLSLYVALNSSSCTSGFFRRMVLIRRTATHEAHTAWQTQNDQHHNMGVGLPASDKILSTPTPSAPPKCVHPRVPTM